MMQDFFQHLISAGKCPQLLTGLEEFCASKGTPVQSIVNMTSRKGTGFLHAACYGGNVSDVIFLLRNQANINATDREGRTPLLVACLRGHVEIVDVLLGKKPQVDIRTQGSGRTALHACVDSGNVNLVRKLMNSFCLGPGTGDEKAAFVSAGDNAGWSALHIAAEKGVVEIVETLLQNAAPVDAPNNKGATPLFQVCLNGHLDIARILLEEHQADANRASSDNTTPLHVACTGKSDRADIVLLLLGKKARADAKEKSKGWTALHLSAANGSTRSVEALLATTRGSRELVRQAGFEGVTPLHLACGEEGEGLARVADTLLRHGARVDARDRRGSTPLHVAALSGRVEAVRVLLKHGASEVARNHGGHTPLELAHNRSHGLVVDILMPDGAGLL